METGIAIPCTDENKWTNRTATDDIADKPMHFFSGVCLSCDYEKVQKEIDRLKKQLGEAEDLLHASLNLQTKYPIDSNARYDRYKRRAFEYFKNKEGKA